MKSSGQPRAHEKKGNLTSSVSIATFLAGTTAAQDPIIRFDAIPTESERYDASRVIGANAASPLAYDGFNATFTFSSLSTVFLA